jgi:hypothetical protein
MSRESNNTGRLTACIDNCGGSALLLLQIFLVMFKLINSVREVLDKDPDIRDRLKPKVGEAQRKKLAVTKKN